MSDEPVLVYRCWCGMGFEGIDRKSKKLALESYSEHLDEHRARGEYAPQKGKDETRPG